MSAMVSDDAALNATGVIRVLLVDDHPVVRAGVATVLEGAEWLRVVGQAATGEQAIQMARKLRPQVVVADMRLPDFDGVEVCAHLASEMPTVRTLILTQFAHEGAVLRAFEAGAQGFMVKAAEPDELRHAVRVVASGDTYVDPTVGHALINLATKGRRVKGPHGLTLQEMRVLSWLPKGLSNAGIGEELGLSSETVKTHLRNAMRKLGVSDRAEAAAFAIREGLA